MIADLSGRLLRADALHTPQQGEVQALDDVLIDIGADGTIDALHLSGTESHARLLASEAARVVTAPPGCLLIPGLVDLHVHAPQYPQLGTALDLPLEEWLDTYTFPLEARYADTGFAARVYGQLVRDLLASGSTTAVYFATIHDAATCILADSCIVEGQRAFVGRVAMDHPDTCPDYYRDASAQAAIEGTRRVIGHIRTHPDNAQARVRPIIAPRFIPSCTDTLLQGLGELAAETGVPVTTHASEGDWEHNFVLDRHGMSDTASLDRFGLLRPGSVLAHCCFVSPDDMRLMASRDTGIAHCPWSNAYFGNAAFPLRRALQTGVRVGLGSDISGGPTSSVLETAKLSVAVARMLESGTDPDLPPTERSAHAGARIDAVTAFWLATAGGADVLGLPVGRFAVGQQFDALLIDPEAQAGGLPLWRETAAEAPARRLERLLHGTTRANIADVFVDGRRVAGQSSVRDRT